MCSFLVWKNACLNCCEFDLEGDLVGVPHAWYLSAHFFHNTNKTCLKCVGYCGFEWVEKEMCLFAEDMSSQTHFITEKLS